MHRTRLNFVAGNEAPISIESDGRKHNAYFLRVSTAMDVRKVEAAVFPMASHFAAEDWLRERGLEIFEARQLLTGIGRLNRVVRHVQTCFLATTDDLERATAELNQLRAAGICTGL